MLPNHDFENSSLGLLRNLKVVRSADPLNGQAALDTLTVRYVVATGAVVSVATALLPEPSQPIGTATYAATCAPCSGVSVDLAAGTVSFNQTTLAATVLSGSPAAATLNGTLKLPDYRPRAGTTLTAAALAACSINSVPVSAQFSDLTCLAGTYVGTGVNGQACTVKVDNTAQRFTFDNGVKNSSFDFALSGGFTNLSTFRSAFTQSAQISQPSQPLATISVQSSPSPVVSGVYKVDLQNVQAVGGTQTWVYYHPCRIEFNTAQP
jgi:hypothetical protein